jgi:hypothetical protein
MASFSLSLLVFGCALWLGSHAQRKCNRAMAARVAAEGSLAAAYEQREQAHAAYVRGLEWYREAIALHHRYERIQSESDAMRAICQRLLSEPDDEVATVPMERVH